MVTVEQARKIEPALEKLSDEQVLDILKDMYGLSQLAFEKWTKKKVVPNLPQGYCQFRRK